jgi:4-hydroxybenzoate polyprenyltransferase
MCYIRSRRITVREAKILLALAYVLAIMACLTPSATTAPSSALAIPVLLTDAETQPWSALSDYLLN